MTDNRSSEVFVVIDGPLRWGTASLRWLTGIQSQRMIKSVWTVRREVSRTLLRVLKGNQKLKVEGLISREFLFPCVHSASIEPNYPPKHYQLSSKLQNTKARWIAVFHQRKWPFECVQLSWTFSGFEIYRISLTGPE